jgi:predicted metalloendopeptidase
MDGSGDEEAGAGEARQFTPKIGYPNKWRDYSKLEIKKDDLVGNIMRAFEHENNLQLGQGWQADRSRGMGHDAADDQCLLQPGPK